MNWPSHLTPLVSRLYPMGHSHRKEPSVLMHWPLTQGSLIHSSISAVKGHRENYTLGTNKTGNGRSSVSGTQTFGLVISSILISLIGAQTIVPLWRHEVQKVYQWCTFSVCVCLCLCDRKRTHPLRQWGRFHRGFPSLDLAFQYSSMLPWMCSEVSERGRPRSQTWCSSSSHVYLMVESHSENKRSRKLETLLLRLKDVIWDLCLCWGLTKWQHSMSAEWKETTNKPLAHPNVWSLAQIHTYHNSFSNYSFQMQVRRLDLKESLCAS